MRSASSERLRSRVNGVFRSWAILSETSLKPRISASMRSSMMLRLTARRSSFVVAAADRQPLGKIACHDGSRGFRHGIDSREHTACDKETAGEAQHDDDRDRPLARGTDDVEKPFAFFQVTADQQAEAAGELEHPHQRVMLGAVRIVEPAIHGFCPARRFHHTFGE